MALFRQSILARQWFTRGAVLAVLSMAMLAPAKASIITLGISLDGSVRLGGLTILDQSPLDLDPALNSVSWSQTIRGFQISGTLVGLTPDPLDPIVRINNMTFQCTDTLLGCGAIPIVFFGTFDSPTGIADATAFDGLQGVFSNASGLGPGASIQFQGFVNAAPVGDLFAFSAPAGSTSAPFSDSNTIPFVVPPGLIFLDGVANVSLTSPGDTLTLNFAEVGVLPTDGGQVIPEPSSILLSGGGMALLMLIRARYAKKKKPTQS